MRFAYKRRGGPLLDWSGPTPPSPTRAGETRSLGEYDRVHGGQALSYGRGLGSLELNVPRPGAPEIVSGYESPHPNAALIHFGADEKAASAKFDTGLIRKAAALAAGFHGVRRNNGSIFWGVIWAAAAFITPFNGVLVPVWAAGQGFAQARPRSNPAMGAATRKKRRRMFVKQKARRPTRRRTIKRRPRNVSRQRTKRARTRRGY